MARPGKGQGRLIPTSMAEEQRKSHRQGDGALAWSAVVTSSAAKRGKSTSGVSSIVDEASVQFGFVFRLSRIIGPSNSEDNKLPGVRTSRKNTPYLPFPAR